MTATRLPSRLERNVIEERGLTGPQESRRGTVTGEAYCCTGMGPGQEGEGLEVPTGRGRLLPDDIDNFTLSTPERQTVPGRIPPYRPLSNPRWRCGRPLSIRDR